MRYEYPSDRAARIRQLEDRIERLGQLLDEVWDIASDALGEKYVNNGATPNARPTKHVAALHVIAEKAASALGSIHINEYAKPA